MVSKTNCSRDTKLNKVIFNLVLNIFRLNPKYGLLLCNS